MKNNLDIITLLSAYEKICKNGKLTERGTELNGIICSESHDGYNVYFADEEVSLDINFHNTYRFSTVSKEHNINHTQADHFDVDEKKIKTFVSKLQHINDAYN
ncbi:DUF3081 family protein [Photobacterium damselae]|uniref:DUF3081 family protein n=1 Tax=Photobacterium damselae TaxID=38293 RepID=UPI0040683A58